MKLMRTLVLFDKGNLINSPDWKQFYASYSRAIAKVDFPQGSGLLTLREKWRPNKKADWKRNGVKYLKERFLQHMIGDEGWRPEGVVDLARNRVQPPITLYPEMVPYVEPITSDFGGFDFVTSALSGARIAIEWETGNISSSHRSLNKLSLALANGVLEIGVIIVPSRHLYSHLTDRIGNIGELSGYLSLWESMKSQVTKGLLAVSVVEHDALTTDVSLPFLPLGVDGRSKNRKLLLAE